MTLDKAIQRMLYTSNTNYRKSLAWLANKEREATITYYQSIYNWSLDECEEFLNNASLAYELLAA